MNYNVTLICSDGARTAEISKKLLLELVDKISKNGKETVHTIKGSYEVTGIVIGDVKGKVLVL
ncbi:hypothetical protein P9848_11155 [Geobacillus stearothermophilus]|uniref:Uncharacterized protein n=1 Tax=Geobacillus subterraneus TaxID=129338 RepID=A0A679G1R6_9BACL|nr:MULTISPECIES: hypothetical protein [Geobacillus]MED5042505.1 hypothetical protein [Geobacillus stearothermophilus]WPZ17819.1 hypothetical protein UM396_14635 [Geobacillus subterraneus]BBW99034.1 hypothetical protein GsuE55_38670 [Geobacillus subterraneus]